MTRPMIYQHATEDFEAYLKDACDRLDTPSRNVAYTSTDGVFRTFRARLDPQDALRFADLLPAVLRAIFVANWTLADRRDWADRETLTREVKSLRQHHNFSPDSVISDIAWSLRRHIDQPALDTLLATLSPQAQAFWRPSPGLSSGQGVRAALGSFPLTRAVPALSRNPAARAPAPESAESHMGPGSSPGQRGGIGQCTAILPRVIPGLDPGIQQQPLHITTAPITPNLASPPRHPRA